MLRDEEMFSQNSCINRAEPDEPVFVLVAHDPCASNAIRHWAEQRLRSGLNKVLDPKIQEAFKLAQQMDEWRLTHQLTP